jgi:GxxExxY protein
MINAGPNIRDDLLYQEESAKIIEACKEVYKKFGGSFKESVVDNALTVALEKKGLKADSQKRIDIYFEGVKVGVYVPDKVVNEIIILEIKCKPFLVKEDEK